MGELARDLYDDDFYAWTRTQAKAPAISVRDGWKLNVFFVRAALDGRKSERLETKN